MKPKVDPSKKTTWYFPGKAPMWADSTGEEAASSVQPITSTQSLPNSDSRLARLEASRSSVPVSSRARRVVSSSVVESISENFESIKPPVQEGIQKIDVVSDEQAAMAQRRQNQLQRLQQVGIESAESSSSIPSFTLSADRVESSTSEPVSKISSYKSDSESESEYETVTDSSEEGEEGGLIAVAFCDKLLLNFTNL